MDNRLILVAGSGRSGTSLFSGIAKALGAHVPQPEVTADKTNPHGFGEPKWVVDFHSNLLQTTRVHPSDARPSAWARTAEIGRDWDVQAELGTWVRREFRHGDHVVVKDPRLLWFIPLWKRVGETVAAPCFVTTLRHPLEVVKSKQTYYGGNAHPNSRVAGWLNTMLYTERATRGSRQTLVRYDDLLSDCMQALARVSDELDLALIERASPAQMRAAARLVDPSLRRARATWSSLGVDDRLIELAEETWETFDRAATTDSMDGSATRSDLDQLRERYVDLYAFAESLAESSVFAAQRDGVSAQRRGDRSAGVNPSISSLRGMRRLVRRAKRKARRTIYRSRSRTSGRPSSEPESSPSAHERNT
ncbi:MAG: sulfotransferase family protein [Actinomycetota bacterium]